MLGFLKGYAWSKWVHGLWAAVIGGGATSALGSLSLIGIDPNTFNFHTGEFYKAAAAVFISGAVTNFFAYLKQHPTPDIEQ